MSGKSESYHSALSRMQDDFGMVPDYGNRPEYKQTRPNFKSDAGSDFLIRKGVHPRRPGRPKKSQKI